MIYRYILLIIFCFTTCPLFAGTAPSNELYRLRVRNAAGGLVQVSLDGGESYSACGRVIHAANNRIIGFAAATYTGNSAVAATAVHGIRVKIGTFSNELGKAGMPLIFSISPIEFSVIPKGYGGHIPRSSAIQTDIHTGVGIFREFAPASGSLTYVEKDGILSLLKEDFSPSENDVFVIIALRPEENITSIDFDNKVGGDVTANYGDGTKKTIASVERRMSSAGRYDATTFTGVGLINTNHGGVITVSSAPVCPFDTVEGGAVETRGGFMIQPFDHVKEQHEYKTQVMVVKGKSRLEGTPPLFGKYLCLHPACYAQVKISNGDWTAVPQAVGKIEGAFNNVTAVRINLPDWNKIDLRPALKKAVSQYDASAAHTPAPKDITVTSHIKSGTVVFFVDGVRKYATNAAPYAFSINTDELSDGFHEIKSESAENTEAQDVKYIFVKKSGA